jgi:hypothetical protein
VPTEKFHTKLPAFTAVITVSAFIFSYFSLAAQFFHFSKTPLFYEFDLADFMLSGGILMYILVILSSFSDQIQKLLIVILDLFNRVSTPKIKQTLESNLKKNLALTARMEKIRKHINLTENEISDRIQQQNKIEHELVALRARGENASEEGTRLYEKYISLQNQISESQKHLEEVQIEATELEKSLADSRDEIKDVEATYRSIALLIVGSATLMLFAYVLLPQPQYIFYIVMVGISLKFTSKAIVQKKLSQISTPFESKILQTSLPMVLFAILCAPLIGKIQAVNKRQFSFSDEKDTKLSGFQIGSYIYIPTSHELIRFEDAKKIYWRSELRSSDNTSQ